MPYIITVISKVKETKKIAATRNELPMAMLQNNYDNETENKTKILF